MAEVSAGQIAAVRAFNRFYTGRIGALNEGLLASPFSLTEMRVLYELAHREGLTAAELGDDLQLDAGYLSRILRRFQARGLIARSASAEDGRARVLSLTKKGRATFAPYDRRSSDGSRGDARRLVRGGPAAARLGDDDDRAAARAGPPVAGTGRPARAAGRGTSGWIVHRHGALYAAEYGWGERFEGLVARVVADFLAGHDPRRERCWIAERDGEILGSVLLVRQSDRVAKLRLLLVEPEARGLGIGRRLVEECVAFARRRGYRRVVLWTNARLDAARAIYEKTGFRLVRSEPSAFFGPSEVEQVWRLDLDRL